VNLPLSGSLAEGEYRAMPDVKPVLPGPSIGRGPMGETVFREVAGESPE
jgi:hypothetical protein